MKTPSTTTTTKEIHFGEEFLDDDDDDEADDNDDDDGDDEEVVTLYGATKYTTVMQSKLRHQTPSTTDANRCCTRPFLEGASAAAVDSNGVDVVLSGEVPLHRVSPMNISNSVDGSEFRGSHIVTKTFPYKHWWKHPKVRENYRVVLASILLTLFGTCLAIAGIIIEVSQLKTVQSYMFFGAGAICLIPGVYHLVYFYCAIRGANGFSFHNMPVFK